MMKHRAEAVINLPLRDIKIPPKEKMPRKITGVDPKIVDRYAKLIRDGYQGFPPIEIWQKVCQDGRKEWWIVSGIHRYKAALAAGKETFPCKVQEFPERDFLFSAYLANLKHGVPYKRDDHRLVMQQLYREGRTIKEICKKSDIPERTLQSWMKPFADKKRKDMETTVRKLRDEGLTQEKIAKEVGVSQVRVSQILKKTATLRKVLDTEIIDKKGSHRLNICSEMLTENKESSFESPGQVTDSIGDIPPHGDSYTKAEDDLDQHQDNPKARDIKEISSYLKSLDVYRELPPEDKKVIRVMALAKLYKQDVISIMDEIGESLIWIRNILILAISLALMGDHKPEKVADVTNALGIDSRVGELIQQFLPYGTMLRPIGPDMGKWAQENFSEKDMDLIATLAGINRRDLPYCIRGEKPPRNKRPFKDLPVEEIELVDEVVVTIYKGWCNDIRKGVYDDQAKKEFLGCSNRVMIIINELRDAIRAFSDEAEGRPYGRGKGRKGNHLEQFGNIVKMMVRKNQYTSPEIDREDLEGECWKRVMEVLDTWDPTKGDINFWVYKNLKWKIMDLQKEEYKRKKTISRYKAYVENLGQDRKDMHY